MRIHRCLVFAIAAISAGFTDRQIEDARIWAHQTNDIFRACLQAEVQHKLYLRMTRDNFASFIKGACVPETRAFRVLLVDYLAMKHPEIDAETHLATTDSAIQQWRDAATQLYVESDGVATPAD
jgi:hypothetical protein